VNVPATLPVAVMTFVSRVARLQTAWPPELKLQTWATWVKPVPAGTAQYPVPPMSLAPPWVSMVSAMSRAGVRPELTETALELTLLLAERNFSVLNGGVIPDQGRGRDAGYFSRRNAFVVIRRPVHGDHVRATLNVLGRKIERPIVSPAVRRCFGSVGGRYYSASPSLKSHVRLRSR